MYILRVKMRVKGGTLLFVSFKGQSEGQNKKLYNMWYYIPKELE